MRPAGRMSDGLPATVDSPGGLPTSPRLPAAQLPMMMLKTSNEPLQLAATTRVEWVTDLERIRALERWWRPLEQGLDRRAVVPRFDYVVPWYRHYRGVGHERYGEPLVGVAWRGGEVVGIAPLTAWRGSFGKVPLRRIDFVGFNADGGEFLIGEDPAAVAAEFVRSLCRESSFDLLCLNGIEPGSETLSAIGEVAGECGLALGELPYRYATVDLSRGFESYRRSMSRNFRRNIKRLEHRVRSAGEPVVERLPVGGDRGPLPAFLERMFAIADASWKARADGPMAEHHREFYRQTLTRFAARGEVDFAILTLGGKDAAFLAALVDRDVYFDFTISFADEFSAVSPGIYLMLRMLELLPHDGIRRVVSHGDHEYKLRWASGWVAQRRLCLFGHGVRAALARMMKFGVEPQLDRLRGARGTS